jgi:hypothetical protein
MNSVMPISEFLTVIQMVVMYYYFLYIYVCVCVCVCVCARARARVHVHIYIYICEFYMAVRCFPVFFSKVSGPVHLLQPYTFFHCLCDTIPP